MPQDHQPLHIHCSACGSPAKFDIAGQTYRCAFCGAETGIGEALAEKRGFRELHREKLQKQKRDHPLWACACTGCGATVVFPEGEALTGCAFCGRSLVRKEYLTIDGFPELLIPFRITKDQAKERLLAWCRKHPLKRESRDVRRHVQALNGFYLPYELVKGPTDCTVQRKGHRAYRCRGFLEGSFVNASRQFDNQLLDGMEPYDLEDVREFDFSCLAGQRVKLPDTDDLETASRVSGEIAGDYMPFLSRAMESRAVDITPSTESLMRMSAVLPVYYLRAGKTLAAVNGQTGKTAVREGKDHYLLPWWLRPIFWTLVFSGLIYAAALLLGAEQMGALLIGLCMAAFLLIVLLTAYHNQYGGTGRQKLRRRIFASDKSRPVIQPPEFYETIEGGTEAVELRFTTPLRVLGMVSLAAAAVFLPVILAFLLNGFSFAGLTLGGAAVWLCVTVPVAPVLLLNYGRLELYDHPLIWRRTPEGQRVRWRARKKKNRKQYLDAAKSLLSPGALLIFAVVLIVLIINVELVLHWDQY